MANKNIPKEVVITTINGMQLRAPAYPAPCNFVTVTDRQGKEVGHWDESEWHDAPAEVMGAIIGALTGQHSSIITINNQSGE